LLFGGDSIKQFIAILFVGLLTGTYSSIFIAVPLLAAWQRGEKPFVWSRHAQSREAESAG
jgi:preprotein translocase subunit SecF